MITGNRLSDIVNYLVRHTLLYSCKLKTSTFFVKYMSSTPAIADNMNNGYLTLRALMPTTVDILCFHQHLYNQLQARTQDVDWGGGGGCVLVHCGFFWPLL